MIAWLKGRILHIEKNEITVNTGNIGYSVFIGENRLLQMGVQKDKEIELVIYTLVREDEIRLFGFDSFLSRSVFMILLSVNGIGPKAAANIIDKLEPNTIIAAIKKGDHFPFLAVSGIGKKTAQRIILDLQGKLDSFVTDQVGSEVEMDKQPKGNEPEQLTPLKLIKDAKSALSNLGFTDREADRVVRQHLNPGISLDEIIRKSLAELRQ
jgi:Holliday junction DNA helicase RuvA